MYFYYLIFPLLGVFIYKSKYKLTLLQSLRWGFDLGLVFLCGSFVIYFIQLTIEGSKANILLALLSGALGYSIILGIKKRNLLRLMSIENEIKWKREEKPSVNDESKFNKVETFLAGVNFQERQENIRKLVEGEEIKLLREPANPYNKNAVHVVSIHDETLGYLPYELSDHISPTLDKFGQTQIIGSIVSRHSFETEPSIIHVKIRFQIPT